MTVFGAMRTAGRKLSPYIRMGQNKFQAAKVFAAQQYRELDEGGTLKNFAFGGAAIMLLPGTLEEKKENLITHTVLWYTTMGMKNPFRQAFWSAAAMMAPQAGDLVRGLVSAQRSVEAQRTSAAIPFSHSTIAMDQAVMSLQYASSRLNSAYSGVSSQAAMYAAKYMTRG